MSYEGKTILSAILGIAENGHHGRSRLYADIDTTEDEHSAEHPNARG